MVFLKLSILTAFRSDPNLNLIEMLLKLKVLRIPYSHQTLW
jgi:hypothetical protein